MTPRLASLLAGLVLALTTSILPLPGDIAAPESLAVCQADGSTASAAAPAGQQEVPAWDPTAPIAAAPSCNQECDAFCAPLQGRCKAGSCFCLRDPP